MALSQQVTITLNAGDIQDNQVVTVTTDSETKESLVVPISTTNQAAAIGFTLSKVALVYISANTDVTLKTNSTGSPQDTILVKAGKPLVWYVGSGLTNPFAGNVTGFYFSNASATVAATVIASIMYASA